MPSVPASHGWILWEIASSRLKAEGYMVEKAYGTLYARRFANDYPHRLSIVNGKCSPRSVERLIKKLNAED